MRVTRLSVKEKVFSHRGKKSRSAYPARSARYFRTIFIFRLPLTTRVSYDPSRVVVVSYEMLQATHRRTRIAYSICIRRVSVFRRTRKAKYKCCKISTVGHRRAVIFERLCAHFGIRQLQSARCKTSISSRILQVLRSSLRI